MQDALRVAMNAGHEKVVLQLLNHGIIDLNFEFHESETHHRLCPLGWATQHENLSLVKLFLAKGADLNIPTGQYGPPLLLAVETGNLDLVEALVHKSDQVLSTKALGQAVSQQDSTIVNFLLANGVRCDFEESDRLTPVPRWAGCCFPSDLEPGESIPPLVRAVNLGNASLVQLLLAHGANVNVGYHDLQASTITSVLRKGSTVSYRAKTSGYCEFAT
jgi:serum/glucocorticoid-regulated kinase 2